MHWTSKLHRELLIPPRSPWRYRDHRPQRREESQSSMTPRRGPRLLRDSARAAEEECYMTLFNGGRVQRRYSPPTMSPPDSTSILCRSTRVVSLQVKIFRTSLTVSRTEYILTLVPSSFTPTMDMLLIRRQADLRGASALRAVWCRTRP